MHPNYVPSKPKTNRIVKSSHVWTILTFAKVFRRPFTREDICDMNPIKYPSGARIVRDTLNQLIKMDLIEVVEPGKYQITEEGINTVYWFGGHFARMAKKYSSLSDKPR